MKDQPENIQQKRLAALYEVSSQLGSSLDLTEVLNQVMDAIIKLTDAERGYIVLYDEVTGDLNTAVARNVAQEKIEGQSMQVSRTVIERSVATGKGIVTNNAQEDARFANQTSVVGLQLRSIMCAPLRVRDRILGAVYVDNKFFSSVFDTDDLDLLITFTNQAAIAIQNARLFTRTDLALNRHLGEISLFQRIDQQLNKHLDLDRVLRLALDWAISLTKAESGSIGLLEEMEDEHDKVLRLLVLTEDGTAAPRPVIASGHPVLSRVLAEEKSISIVDVTPEQSIDGTPAATQLVVPIRLEGEIIGLITLESQQSVSLEDDIPFLERLADRASVAINNSRLYERIQAANKAKSDFISVVTHELRLPMTSIRGYADLMNSGMAGPLNEQQQQFLEVIRRNLTRMSDLVRDLGDINRIESGRMKFESRAFDVQETVTEVADNLKEAIAGRHQTLSIEMPPAPAHVFADPTRISQVLTNLLSNANKYTPDHGNLLIKVSEESGFMIISVIDDGLGISEADQAKLFTQFFRAESSQVREQQGWGLGLSIVKKMVEAQGGEIEFESAIGEGSRFTFTIPQGQAEPQR